jgi:hypothetical protein
MLSYLQLLPSAESLGASQQQLTKRLRLLRFSSSPAATLTLNPFSVGSTSKLKQPQQQLGLLSHILLTSFLS